MTVQNSFIGSLNLKIYTISFSLIKSLKPLERVYQQNCFAIKVKKEIINLMKE